MSLPPLAAVLLSLTLLTLVGLRYQCKFVTPYWIRRAQFILFSLMYVCFLGTIILPWAYPFVPAGVPKHTPNFWDDDDDYYDDDNDDKGWLAHTKYKKQWSSFGTYYMTHGDAFYVLAATYIAWAVLALANAVLDFVKDRGTRRARLAPFHTTHRRIAHPAYTVPSEISKAEARKGEGAQESGLIELSPVRPGRVYPGHRSEPSHIQLPSPRPRPSSPRFTTSLRTTSA